MSSLVVPAAEVQPVDYGQIDAAIFAWLGNRVPEVNSRIIWANQGVPQPAYPYLSVLRGTELDEGGVAETRNRTLDSDGDPIPPSINAPVTNEEIVYEPVTFLVTIQAHIDAERGANDPNCNAMKLLSKAKRSLGFRSLIDQLGAAGISIVAHEAVTDISVIVNGEWISRAALDVTFRTASVMSEQVGFFDKTELKSTELGVDVLVDAS